MPTKIIFLLLPHLHLMDLAGADQVFLEAKDFGLDIEVHHCSYSNSITTSSGLVINQLKHYSKIKCNAGDFIFIPGADINFLHSKEFKQQKELLAIALWPL
jgi:transcriptional regulator GlxA family with amidase domain